MSNIQDCLFHTQKVINREIELDNDKLLSRVSLKTNDYIKVATDEVEEWLRQQVVETCRHKSSSTARQQGLTKIIRVIAKSGKLWKDNTFHYEDALQQTWLYFCRNLCEATTGNKYDPNRSSVTTWLNAYLKRRLQDAYIQEQADLAHRAFGQTLEIDEGIDPLEILAAPPDIPPILETTRDWVQNDVDGELRRLYITGHPKVTCQVLILRRLPPETAWKTLAVEFDVSIPTLTSFYKRHCIPCLRKFGKSQGYI